MFKRIILAIAVILPMSVFAQKFGVADLDAIVQAMPEFAQMNAQVEEASKKYQTEFDQLNEELNKLYAEFQTIADDPNTPQAIKQRRMSEIEERNQKVRQFQSTAYQDLERLNQQLSQPIQQKMLEAVQAVGAEGDFTFIFPNGSAVYQGSNVVNVTDLVKAKLGIN